MKYYSKRSSVITEWKTLLALESASDDHLMHA
jgi:hypothetical protein